MYMSISRVLDVLLSRSFHEGMGFWRSNILETDGESIGMSR